MSEVRQGDVNVVSMIVDTYERALRDTHLVFQTSREKLIQTEGEKAALTNNIKSLLHIYQNALSNISDLRKALLNSHGQNQHKSARIITLLETISEINGNLNIQHMKIIKS